MWKRVHRERLINGLDFKMRIKRVISMEKNQQEKVKVELMLSS